MHICFLSLDYPSPSGGGGVGNQTQTLGRALVRQGYMVTVVALAQPGQPAIMDDGGVRVYRVAQGSLHWYIYKLPWLGRHLALAVRELEYGWAAFRQLQRLHAQTPFDLIEATETGAFWLALLLSSLPLVIRLHGEQYTFCKYTPDMPLTVNVRLSRLLQRVAMRRAKLLTSPSQAHAREIAAELGSHCPPIQVIPNAVSLPNSQQPANNRQKTNPTVLFAGRLERVKGVPLLLEAAGQVLRQMPNVQFKLIGAAHPTLSQTELNTITQRLGLNGEIQFLGHLSQRELMGYYQQAELCVLPSYYETFGLAALEPMSLGVPVVAAKTGGLSEVVEDGKTGLLVPPGDGPALAGAIISLLQQPVLRAQMGLAGQQRAQRLFKLEPVVEATLKVYRRVLSHAKDA